MSKYKLFILSFSIVCVGIVAVGLFYWLPELLVERKLASYIERLEKKGYCVEEHLLSDFHVDDSIRMQYYSDLTYAANWDSADHVYFDRKIQAIYFLKPIGDKLDAYIFYFMLGRNE